MKKLIPYLLLFLIIFSTCEKDDFCVQNPVTSKLIIRFYDATNRETLKNVQRFSIFSGSKDPITQYEGLSLDSIAIPLNSLLNETVFTIRKNNVDDTTANDKFATFTIKYDTKEDYVSRSCGYKVVFSNVEFSKDTNINSWVTDFTPTTIINLDDQSAAHVQIFH